MGLFDSVLGDRRTAGIALGPIESFVAIALLSVGIDGHISDDEMNVLRSSLWRLKMFRGYSERSISSMIDNLVDIIRRQGSESLLNAAIVGIPTDLKDTVFAVAADLVLTDGKVTVEEEELLQNLYQALELPKSLAVKILDVMVIKNKG